MDKLLPCPFCGGEATLKTTRKSDGQISYDSSYVLCLDCRSTGLSFTKYYDVSQHPEQEAIAAWNRRAQPENARAHARETGICPMCEDCPDGCPVETPNDSRNRPENEPLTLEELRQMDGEPVWLVEHPKWGHWELSEDAEDYVQDRHEEFYNMTHNDPAGKYGLHAMGWLAYRHKPERSEG